MAYASADLDSGFAIECSWSETSTSVSNNTSNISITGKIWRKTSYNAFSYTGAGSLTVYWHDNKSNRDIAVASIGVDEIGYSVNERSVSGSITVEHLSDGTLSGFAYTHWQKSYNSGYIPPSGNATTGWVALTKIARKVPITAVTGTYTDENFSPTVQWTNNGNRVDIKIELPELGEDSWRRWNNKQGSSSFSPQLSQADIQELYSLMPNTATLTMRFTVVTVINGTDAFYDWLDRTFTIVNGKPVFSDFTFADTDSTTTGITGNDQVMISGKSALAVTISAANKATAQKSATMNNYTFQVAGLTGSETYTTSAITKALGSPTVEATETPSATRELVVTAIDSRGLQTAITKTVTIVPYSSPTISATATRANGFENTTTVKISGTFSRIEVGGTAKNTVNTSSGVQYRYRQQGTSTWGSWTNRTATIDAATGRVTTAAFTLNLDNQAAFEFEFKITDKLETKTASLSVSIGQPVFWIGADGRVSVGGTPTRSKESGDAGLLDVKGRYYGTEGEFSMNDAVDPDTPAGWMSKYGNGRRFTFYNTAGKFTNQPSQYGFLETYLHGSEITQIWHTQSSGRIYIRSGSSNGWYNSASNAGVFKEVGILPIAPTSIQLSAMFKTATFLPNSKDFRVGTAWQRVDYNTTTISGLEKNAKYLVLIASGLLYNKSSATGDISASVRTTTSGATLQIWSDYTMQVAGRSRNWQGLLTTTTATSANFIFGISAGSTGTFHTDGGLITLIRIA